MTHCVGEKVGLLYQNMAQRRLLQNRSGIERIETEHGRLHTLGASLITADRNADEYAVISRVFDQALLTSSSLAVKHAVLFNMQAEHLVGRTMLR